MSDNKPSYHFKVQWRFPKSKAVTADYVAGSLHQLLSMLKRQEDVGLGTTDFLCVHQIVPGGGVKELLVHDVGPTGHTVRATPMDNVVPITKAHKGMKDSKKVVQETLVRIASKDKPRIKAGQGKIARAGYLYVAVEAIPK